MAGLLPTVGGPRLEPELKTAILCDDRMPADVVNYSSPQRAARSVELKANRTGAVLLS